MQDFQVKCNTCKKGQLQQKKWFLEAVFFISFKEILEEMV